LLNLNNDLFYQSGDYQPEITKQNSSMEIRKSKQFTHGCIAVIKF